MSEAIYLKKENSANQILLKRKPPQLKLQQEKLAYLSAAIVGKRAIKDLSAPIHRINNVETKMKEEEETDNDEDTGSQFDIVTY
jgi:hypothetical protein